MSKEQIFIIGLFAYVLTAVSLYFERYIIVGEERIIIELRQINIFLYKNRNRIRRWGSAIIDAREHYRRAERNMWGRLIKPFLYIFFITCSIFSFKYAQSHFLTDNLEFVILERVILLYSLFSIFYLYVIIREFFKSMLWGAPRKFDRAVLLLTSSFVDVMTHTIKVMYSLNKNIQKSNNKKQSFDKIIIYMKYTALFITISYFIIKH